MKEQEKDKKKKRIRHLLIGSGIGLGVIGLGFGWWYFFGRKENKPDEEIDIELIKKTSIPNEYIPKNASSPRILPKIVQDKGEKKSFPIKYGDKGSLVKQVQEGLIKLYGKKILPNYGADGSFKKEMAAALKAKSYPDTIDKPTFDKIVSGKPLTAIAPSSSGKLALKNGVDIAKNIWLNAMLKKNDGMVEHLQRIRNVQDYKMVDALMKTVGQKKPLADVALFAATDDTGNQLIAGEFKRIGLKYKEEKWVLSGIEPSQIITNQETTIRDKTGIGINVPAETLLGEMIASAGPVTTFRTIDDQILYVPTKHITHV